MYTCNAFEFNASELTGWLEKGLGRAALFLQQHDATPYRDLILHACTHNLAYDRQCEDSRDLHLYDILQATGEEDYYRPHLFRALAQPDPEMDAHQLFGLARRMAQAGDRTARHCLYAVFTANTVQQNFAGADEIITLDGLDGFLFVTARFLEHGIGEDPSDWGWWLSQLEERDGTEATWKALTSLPVVTPELRLLLERTQQERAERKRQQQARQARPLPAYAEVKRRIITLQRKAIKGTLGEVTTLSGWGVRADEAELEAAARDLLAEENPDRLAAYTRIFMNRRFPLDPARLLTLARNADEEQAWMAAWALEHIIHPSVRALGMELITDAERIGQGVGMLARNYQAGDYALIETLLRQPLEQFAYHSLGIKVKKLVKAHPLPEAERSLLLLYENGPCSMCRHDCVKLLVQLGRLPEWMRAECRYDADEDTRKLVASVSPS